MHPNFDGLQTNPCSGCGNFNFIVEKAAGDIVCRNCGEVSCDRILDYRPEWKNYEEEAASGKSRDSAARCSKMSEFQLEQGIENTFIMGGTSSDRTVLTRNHVKSTLSREESKYIKSSSLLKTICHKLNLSDRITVSENT
jgi:transcription initiation factor TFIIIB Brf1 subunit/transcription initiation factor TFIIB